MLRTIASVIGNIRPLRTLHYIFLSVFGFSIAGFLAEGMSVKNFVSLSFFLLGIVFGWLFAVFLNDVFDQESDKISNASRPLISGSLSLNSYKKLIFSFFVLAMVSGGLSGYNQLTFVFLFMLVYGFLYSAPPFRIKKLFLLPNILIAFASVAAVMGGASIIFREATSYFFPRNILALIFSFYVLASMIKDLKDYEGDKATSTKTLFTLLGVKSGKIIFSILLIILAFMIVLLLGVPQLLLPLLVINVFAIWGVFKENEKIIFGAEFVGLAIILYFLFTFSIGG